MFGETNIANFDCHSPDVDRCEFAGLPDSIPTAPTNHLPERPGF